MLKRRSRAEESSLTPRSRSLAVAMRLKPRTARTAVFSSGTGSSFSERMVISASWTSLGTRVSSSTRTTRPERIAVITGLATIAASLGPSARSWA